MSLFGKGNSGGAPTNLNSLSDVDLITSVPTEGDSLLYQGGKWVPGAGGTGGVGTVFYLIELNRWGIKNDGTDPSNTTQGISDAIAWAKTQGYGYVKLPVGTYTIGKGTKDFDKATNACIHLQSDMTIDLLGCTLIKETNNWKAYYAIYGKDIKNTTLLGGTLVGDRLTHDFSNTSEIYEWNIGIYTEGATKSFHIEGMEIKEFPGYSISLGGSQYQFKLVQSADIESGAIGATGVNEVNANFTRFKGFVSISIAEPRLSQIGHFMITGNGYNSYGFRTDGGVVNLTNTIFRLHFYDASDVFLGKIERRVFEPIAKSAFPTGATKFKIDFRYDFTKIIPTTFFLGLDTKDLSSGTVIRNCKIHDSYALGVAMHTTTQTLIENNEFYNIGFAMKTVGRHLYPFPMAIDVEDGYNANQHITIRNNIFRDNQSLHVNIVQARNVLIEGNLFMGTGGIVFQGTKGGNLISRHNQYNLTYAQGESSTFVEFINDHFIGATLSLTYKNTYTNCVFDEMLFNVMAEIPQTYSSATVYSLGAYLLPTVKNGFYYVNTASTGVKAAEPTWNTVEGGTTTDASGNIWTAFKYNQKYDPIIFEGCKFNFHQPDITAGWQIRRGNLVFEKCSFKIDTPRYFTDLTKTVNGDFTGNTVVTFNGCDFEGKNFGSILASRITLRNSRFTSTLAPTLYASTDGLSADDLLIEGCTFENIDWMINTNKAILGSSLVMKNNTLKLSKTGRRFGDAGEMFYLKNIETINIEENKILVTEPTTDLRPFVIYAEDYLKFTNNFIKTARATHNIELWGAKRVGGDVTPIPATVSIVDDNFYSKLTIKPDMTYIKQLRKTIGNGWINLESATAGSSDSVSIEPTSGFFYLGQKVYSSAPIAGGYVGWVTVTAGVANGTAWESSKAYALNAVVNANGKVYKCTVAGTSSSTPPSHTTGSAIDGTVTWEYISIKASFKQYGLIAN